MPHWKIEHKSFQANILIDGKYTLVKDEISKIYADYGSHYPEQHLGCESDFTVLLRDGKTLEATLLDIDNNLGDYWCVIKHQYPEFKLRGHSDRFYYNCYSLEFENSHHEYKYVTWIPEFETTRQKRILHKFLDLYL